MTPATGTGYGPTQFIFSFLDTKGYQDLGVVNILINSSTDPRRACCLAYARPINVLYLVNDNGDGLLPGASLAGVPGSLSNSQCTVTWVGDAVAAGGDSLSLSLTLGFKPGLGIGPNVIFYLAARDVNGGNNTGWQMAGSWVP